jgi:hypothetical protein
MNSNRISFQDLLMKLGVDCIWVASQGPDNAPTQKRANDSMINPEFIRELLNTIADL